jgi:hypothetical protein
MKQRRVWVGVGAALMAMSGQAGAAVIPLVSAAASTGLGGTFDRGAIHAVDGTGLVGDAHGTVPDGAMWLNNGTFGAPNDLTPFITFDLGASYQVDSMRVWNYNELNLPNRGIATGRISIAGPDQVFTPLIDSQSFNAAPGTDSDFSQTIALGATARYVRLDNLTNLGDGNAFVGLSEVKFEGTLAPGETRDLPIPATVSDVSSSIFGFNRDASYAVNGAGLGGTMHSRTPNGSMWLNQGTFANVPAEEFDTDPYIVFDVGSEKSLDRMVVWNYNEFIPNGAGLLNRGIKTADILVAGEDGVFTPFIVGQELTIAPGTDDVDFSQAIDLAGTTARYIKLDNLVNYGDVDNFVGLSEVQFYAVPEPTSIALLAIAFGALGVVRRFR